MEGGKFRAKKFNGQNYQLWKMHMEDYLYQKDIYLPLGGKEYKPVSMTDKEWEILDRKALRTIRLCLAVSVYFKISKEKTMIDMLNALEKLYENPLASDKAFPHKRLFNMKM